MWADELEQYLDKQVCGYPEEQCCGVQVEIAAAEFVQ